MPPADLDESRLDEPVMDEITDAFLMTERRTAVTQSQTSRTR
jgi:hypothetical protein